MFNLETIFGNGIKARGSTQQPRPAPSVGPSVHQAPKLPMFNGPTYAHMGNSIPQFNRFPSAAVPGNSNQGTSVAPPAFMALPPHFAAFPGQPPNQPVPFGAPFFAHPGMQIDMQKAAFFRPIMNEVFENLRSPGIIKNGEEFRNRFVEFIHLFNSLSIGAQTLLRMDLSTQLCTTLIGMSIQQSPSLPPATPPTQPTVQTCEMATQTDSPIELVSQNPELTIDTDQASNAGPTPPFTPATSESSKPSNNPVQEPPKIEKKEIDFMGALEKLWEEFEEYKMADYGKHLEEIHESYRTAIEERNKRIEELEANQPVRRKRGANGGEKAPSAKKPRKNNLEWFS